MARRKRKPEEHVNHERWLVRYADFITLLFAFFTTLYAISTVDQSKAGRLMYSMMTALNIDFFPVGKAPSQQSAVGAIVPKDDGKGGHGKRSDMGRIAEELRTLAIDPVLRGRMQVHETQRGIVVSLAEAGFFESGKTDIRKDAAQALEVIGAAIAAHGDLDVLVEGHTDNVPVRQGSNWLLSTARATYVVLQLQQRMGVAPERLSAAGYGEFRPVASNDTPEGRARNRRVDLVLRDHALSKLTEPGAPEAETPPQD